MQDLRNNINMRATFLAGGKGIRHGSYSGLRSIDVAPTIAYVMGVPEPQHAQGRVLTELTDKGRKAKRITIVGLNDFHGQLDPTTRPYDGINTPVGGGAYLASMFDEEFMSLGAPGVTLAGGDNVGASPPNSSLLEDMPAIDVENAWGLDATSYGNHEFDYGRRPAAATPRARRLPVPRHEHRRRDDGRGSGLGDAVRGARRRRDEGRCHRCRARDDT